MEQITGRYKIRNQSAIHFITFAVVGWVDVFSRQIYRDVIIDSLKYCQQKRGLKVHAWVIMTNHLHLVISAINSNLSGILRDFKKYTSSRIIKLISEGKNESRKEWMLRIFREAGKWNARNGENQFWRQDNHPVELYSSKFVWQKIHYIHQNPVKAGIVENPEHYLYSSAKDYFETRQCGILDITFL